MESLKIEQERKRNGFFFISFFHFISFPKKVQTHFSSTMDTATTSVASIASVNTIASVLQTYALVSHIQSSEV